MKKKNIVPFTCFFGSSKGPPKACGVERNYVFPREEAGGLQDLLGSFDVASDF